MSTIVVTGAFSYTGRYVARILLERGHTVRTLTHHIDRANPFGERVSVFPYNFHDPDKLAHSLRGASALINTYWVRFPHGKSTFDTAVQNTRTMIAAARQAGVERIVHVSIANPSLDSPLGYYKGKAVLEDAVKASGLPHTIVRPTVIFGGEDILINNIAWFVRHFPVFGIPGDGCYGIRPIYVEDMARLLVDASESEINRNATIDAVGPQTFTFEELVQLIADETGASARLVHLPPALAYVSTRVIGLFTRDVILTWEEYQGLLANLLVTKGPPTGETRLSDWLRANRDRVGKSYASEIARHFSKR
ncbi:MAG TPA: NAD(P)H-binding protein [Candidatus Acidoferrales bacterium]|nr:NAD(P)H-binding protein [Candidatus Acidoferrales bacterium]